MKKLFAGLAATLICMTLFAPSVFASGVPVPTAYMAVCQTDEITGTGMVDADCADLTSAAGVSTDANKMTLSNDVRLYGLVLNDNRPPRMYEAALTDRHTSAHPVNIGVTVAERSNAPGRDPGWRGFESRPSPLYSLGWHSKPAPPA